MGPIVKTGIVEYIHSLDLENMYCLVMGLLGGHLMEVQLADNVPEVIAIQNRMMANGWQIELGLSPRAKEDYDNDHAEQAETIKHYSAARQN
jgi:hypothetical protein